MCACVKIYLLLFMSEVNLKSNSLTFTQAAFIWVAFFSTLGTTSYLKFILKRSSLHKVVLLLPDSIDLPVQQLHRAITLRAGNAGSLLERHLTSDRTINRGLASTLQCRLMRF